jgi:hypothetical protein
MYLSPHPSPHEAATLVADIMFLKEIGPPIRMHPNVHFKFTAVTAGQHRM